MSDDKDKIKEVMTILGRRTSDKKKVSSRLNGKLGGRPKGTKNEKNIDKTTSVYRINILPDFDSGNNQDQKGTKTDQDTLP